MGKMRIKVLFDMKNKMISIYKLNNITFQENKYTDFSIIFLLMKFEVEINP